MAKRKTASGDSKDGNRVISTDDRNAKTARVELEEPEVTQEEPEVTQEEPKVTQEEPEVTQEEPKELDRRQEIKTFVRENMDTYDIERREDCLEKDLIDKETYKKWEEKFDAYGCDNHTEFFLAKLMFRNDDIIDKMDPVRFERVYNLFKLIQEENKESKNSMFYHMDKEEMVPFPISGFIFSTEGKLISFNER